MVSDVEESAFLFTHYPIPAPSTPTCFSCISEGVIVKMSLIGKCIPLYKKEGLIESNSPLYTY
jgi:hypothetical protein